MSDDFHDRFPRSGPPRKVKGGIRARPSAAPSRESWWARRWLAVLESLQLGGRLARGRAYARTRPGDGPLDRGGPRPRARPGIARRSRTP